MGKSSFGVRRSQSSPQDKADLLKAARLVVVALGYEGISDLEAANVLHGHAQDLKRYRSGGNPAALSFAPQAEAVQVDPACKVEGELPVTPDDLRALLDLKNLSVFHPEDLQRAVATIFLSGVAWIRGAGAFAGAAARPGRSGFPSFQGLHAIPVVGVWSGLRVQWGARLAALAVLRSMQAKGVCCD